MNITLRQLRAFVAVARSGSFTLSAKSHYIKQSARSGLISGLEQTRGCRVVDRSARRIYLSGMAPERFPPVEKILNDLDRVLIEVSERKASRVLLATSATMLAFGKSTCCREQNLEATYMPYRRISQASNSQTGSGRAKRKP